MGLISVLFARSRPIDESPLGQSRQVAGGSEGRLRYPSFLSSGDLVLRQEQAGGKELAGAPVAAEGNRKDGGRGRRPRPSGLRQPDDAQDLGRRRTPNGTLYPQPAPKIAVQIYSQGLMTQMRCRASRWRRARLG